RGADGLRGYARPKDLPGRCYREEAEEIAHQLEPYKWYPQRQGRVDLVMQRARDTGKIADPVVRQEIARLLTLAKTAEWTALRARAAQAHGRPQGPEGALGKLAASVVARRANPAPPPTTSTDAMLTGLAIPMRG